MPGSLPSDAAPWLPRAKPVSLPYPPLGAHFIGRAAILSRMHDAVRNGAAVMVLEGMGGIGKTRAAVEYAHAHREDYTAVLFLNAETPDALLASIVGLADTLGLPATGSDPEKQKSVTDWLRRNPGWLLIFDNIDTDAAEAAVAAILRDLRGGYAILTSRRHGFSTFGTSVALESLTPADAADLLLARTEDGRRVTPNDAGDARALGTDLGGVPLALEQAAETIRQRHCSFADYRDLLQKNRESVTGWNAPVIATYRPTASETLAIAAAHLTDGARRLLERLAFLAPDPVPMTLLDEGAENSLSELARHRLAVLDEATQRFSVHALVQDAVRRSLDAVTARGRLTEVLAWIDAAFIGDPQDVRTWPVLNPLAPHAETVLAQVEAAGISTPTVRLSSNLGRLFHAQALPSRAEPLLRRALAIDEVNYGAGHPNVAIHLNNLAQLLKDTNRLGEAEPLMRRALAIGEASYGAEHPRMALRLNNLAQLLQATNRLEEAEPLMRRALAIAEAGYGTEHPYVANCLNNLTTLLQTTNRLGEAEPLLRRALSIDEASYGAEHPNVATDLNNLPGLLQATNRLREAEPLMRRALAIDEASYGADHPDVAIDLATLAGLLQATNRLGEAEPLMRRMVVIFLTFQRATGHPHPHRDAALANHANLLRAMGRDEAAIEAEQRAMHRESGLE